MRTVSITCVAIVFLALPSAAYKHAVLRNRNRGEEAATAHRPPMGNCGSSPCGGGAKVGTEQYGSMGGGSLDVPQAGPGPKDEGAASGGAKKLSTHGSKKGKAADEGADPAKAGSKSTKEPKQMPRITLGRETGTWFDVLLPNQLPQQVLASDLAHILRNSELPPSDDLVRKPLLVVHHVDCHHGPCGMPFNYCIALALSPFHAVDPASAACIGLQEFISNVETSKGAPLVGRLPYSLFQIPLGAEMETLRDAGAIATRLAEQQP